MPCEKCTTVNLTCTYEAPYNRGSRKRKSTDTPTPSLSAITEDRPLETSSIANTVTNGAVGIATPVDTESNEVSNLDTSSSIAFLDRAMKRLERHNPVARFSFRNPKIPDFDAASFLLPSLNEAQKLTAYYFDYIASTNRILHRPTIEAQISSFYTDKRLIMTNSDLDRGICSTLFITFALSSCQMESSPNAGIAYYLAAERQVKACKDTTTLSCVQTHVLMVLYLAMTSRMDQAWLLLGNAVRLAQTLGLHRKGRRGNIIHHEMRKRTFWVLYIVDRLVSVVVGKPCGLHDLDIDQDYPSALDDEELLLAAETGSGRLRKSGFCLMEASIQHIKLTRLVSEILTSFYSTQKSLGSDTAMKHIQNLDMWKKDLPAYLDEEKIEADPRIPILRHARALLFTAYYHAQMLIYRPFLTGSSIQFGADWITMATNECLRISKLMFTFTSDLVGRGLLEGWFLIYNSINAILVVYVHTIQNMFPGMQLPELFLAAQECEHILRENTRNNVLTERFILVLKELRLEIHQQISISRESNSNGNGGLELLVDAPALVARLPLPEDLYELSNYLMSTLNYQIWGTMKPEMIIKASRNKYCI